METGNTFPTATSIYAPFYKFLNIIGIYPYTIEYHPVSKNFKGILPISKLSGKKSGISVIWHKIVILIWSVHALFQTFQFIRHLLFLKSESSITLSLTAWTGTSVLAWMVGFKYHIHGDWICRMVTKTNCLEGEIYEKYGNTRRSHVSNCVKQSQRNHCRLKISIILFNVLGSGVMIMKHLQDPNFPAFIYCIIPEGWKNNASLAFSFAFESLFLCYALGFAVQLVTGCLNFCRVLEGCLDIISFHDEENNDDQENEQQKQQQQPDYDGGQLLLQEMDEALKYYKLLSDLMQEDNRIFSTTISYQFGGYFVLGCITAFLPLQYWGEASPLSLLSYVFLFVTLIYIFCRIFPGMGSVYDKSKAFKLSWQRGVAFSGESLRLVVEHERYFKVLRLRLKSCAPFGFKCGNFFYIRTFTMLTFFSAISTYLIIMLQFGL